MASMPEEIIQEITPERWRLAKQIFQAANGSTTDLNPVWSPDGKYLYFSSNRGGSMNIWRAPIDEKSGATLGEPEAVTTIGAATSALHLSFSREGGGSLMRRRKR